MNNDLISRSALLQRIDKERKYLLERGQTGAEHILVQNFRELVEEAPKATPERPLLILENGESLYLTQGHIDCLLEYEKQETIKEILEKFKTGGME